LATGELQSFSFLVVYLAIIQGSLAAGQWLSFGPSKILPAVLGFGANVRKTLLKSPRLQVASKRCVPPTGNVKTFSLQIAIAASYLLLHINREQVLSSAMCTSDTLLAMYLCFEVFP
jgi:hypothetical protein